MKAKKVSLIDTNFILRFFLNDIPIQTKKSQELFKEIEEKKVFGVINLLVINELIWILGHFYNQKRRDFIPQILKLISLKNIKILEIKKSHLILILEKMKKANLDFTDLYLIHLAKKSEFKIASFDKKLLKSQL